MNIFYLDQNPDTCAEYHCDKHLVKMIVETAQLLCSVYWMNGAEAPYKLTHKNHPCAVWARQSTDNFHWLYKFNLALIYEYRRRYGKQHKTYEVLRWIASHNIAVTLPRTGFTNPPQVMPDEYKLPNTVEAYRNYYVKGKKDMAFWNHSATPNWYTQAWLHNYK